MAQPEKKYGLIDPKKKLTVADVFKNDSDSNDDTKINVQKNPEKGLKKQTVIDMNRALLEDPTVYQYDEVYDIMKKTETDISNPKSERKTKYMDALMKSADKRKKENERRTERLVQKEREAEGETFKDKEEFITSSYRKKLEENKIAEEEERKMEYIESVMDVAKQPDLGSFYRQLYKVTIPEPEPKVEQQLPTEKVEETKKVSSSSSDTSSSDSSSSDSSSTDDDVPKKAEMNPINPNETKKILEDGEIASAPDEEKKLIEKNGAALKFGFNTKRDRTYRQRDSDSKKDESGKSTVKETSHRPLREEKQSNVKERNRDRDRGRDRDRNNRDDRRSDLSWRSKERNRDDRKSDRHRRSRSRSNRDSSRRNAFIKHDEKKNKSEPSDHKKRSEKSSQPKSVTEQKNDKVKVKEEKIISNDQVKNHSNIKNKENTEQRINIWIKRTVGPVFEGALERYFQRKAAKRET